MLLNFLCGTDNVSSLPSLEPIDSFCNTHLHRLARLGNCEVLKDFLDEQETCDVDQTNIFGITPLHEACDVCALSYVSLLLKKGAKQTPRIDGKTPQEFVQAKIDALQIREDELSDDEEEELFGWQLVLRELAQFDVILPELSLDDIN